MIAFHPHANVGGRLHERVTAWGAQALDSLRRDARWPVSVDRFGEPVAQARTPTEDDTMRTSDWLLVVGFVAACAPGVLEMAAVWDRVDYYSHGYLVPLVALWAASAKRGVLPRLEAGRDPRGIAVLVGAMGLYAVGLGGSVLWLAGFGIVGGVAGLVYFLRGAAWLRELSFSIGYLLFMVPLPEEWLNPVIVNLQLFVSSVGVSIAQAAGISVLRIGNVMQLPNGDQLFVAEACSGITSLITLLPLGVFLAYFTERGWGRRCLLILTVVPVALAGNLLRVVATVWAADRFGADVATGSALHDWVGVLTYVLACVVLLGCGSLMRKAWPARRGLAPAT